MKEKELNITSPFTNIHWLCFVVSHWPVKNLWITNSFLFGKGSDSEYAMEKINIQACRVIPSKGIPAGRGENPNRVTKRVSTGKYWVSITSPFSPSGGHKQKKVPLYGTWLAELRDQALTTENICRRKSLLFFLIRLLSSLRNGPSWQKACMHVKVYQT